MNIDSHDCVYAAPSALGVWDEVPPQCRSKESLRPNEFETLPRLLRVRPHIYDPDVITSARSKHIYLTKYVNGTLRNTAMTSAEVRPLTNNFSELDITEVDDSKRLTLSYMRATEPWTWDSFPSLYHHSKERPRPRFSYGITASDEEIEKVAANLEPRLASYFRKSFPTAFIVVRRHFNQACGLPSMGITFEGVYSKDLDAPYIFSLTNTYDRKNMQHITALEDLLTSELRAVGWGYKTLKWYISDENFNDLDREDWSEPTSNSVIEH